MTGGVQTLSALLTSEPHLEEHPCSHQACWAGEAVTTQGCTSECDVGAEDACMLGLGVSLL